MPATEYIVNFSVLCAFSYPLVTLGLHCSLRDILEQHLAETHSKRAMKDARHGHVPQHPFSGIRMEWQRSLAGADDRSAQRLGICNDICLLLFPFGEALCIAGYWNSAAAWAAAVLNLCVLLSLASERLVLHHKTRASAKKKHVRYAKTIRAAHLLHKGYVLPALGLTIARILLPAGILLLANAVHILILRAKHADLFYCTMQLADRRPVTPHRHTDGARRHAEREGLRLAVILLVLGFGDILLGVLKMTHIL